MSASYTVEYFKARQAGAQSSASALVPIVHKMFQPKSVVDVGCATGSWLKQFELLGVSHLVGIDREYVPNELLETSTAEFVSHDLTELFRSDHQFDLVICLETAEHLPVSASRTLIESLAGLGPLVLFSAAIPFQGGHGHLNERWPDYWADLFRLRGYYAVDCLREMIWSDNRVAWWYSQNTIVYAKEEVLRKHPHLKRYIGTPHSLVHPQLYLSKLKR